MYWAYDMVDSDAQRSSNAVGNDEMMQLKEMRKTRMRMKRKQLLGCAKLDAKPLSNR